MYYYFFYKIYKFLQLSFLTKGNTKYKAVLIIINLEILTVFSFFNYEDVFFKQHVDVNFFSVKVLLPVILLGLIKWFLFSRDDRWMDYVKKFDQWPKKKNRIGTVIVIGIVALLVANFIASVHFNIYTPAINNVQQ